MGGANPSRDSGSADAPTTTRSKVTKYRGEGGVVDFIKKGGFTGAILRGVKKAFDPKRNRKSKSGDVYAYDEAKEKIDYKAPTIINNNNDRDGNNNSILSTNTEATKQVESSGIVTERVIAPTNAEVSQATATNAVEPSASYSSDATILANNKKGRKSTILLKAKGLGDSNLNTTKRTLGA